MSLCFCVLQPVTPSAPPVAADQDSVRLLAVECCGPLAQLSSKDDITTHILPVVQKFSQVGRGSSWQSTLGGEAGWRSQQTAFEVGAVGGRCWGVVCDAQLDEGNRAGQETGRPRQLSAVPMAIFSLLRERC